MFAFSSSLKAAGLFSLVFKALPLQFLLMLQEMAVALFSSVKK